MEKVPRGDSAECESETRTHFTGVLHLQRLWESLCRCLSDVYLVTAGWRFLSRRFFGSCRLMKYLLMEVELWLSSPVLRSFLYCLDLFLSPLVFVKQFCFCLLESRYLTGAKPAWGHLSPGSFGLDLDIGLNPLKARSRLGVAIPHGSCQISYCCICIRFKTLQFAYKALI